MILHSADFQAKTSPLSHSWILLILLICSYLFAEWIEIRNRANLYSLLSDPVGVNPFCWSIHYHGSLGIVSSSIVSSTPTATPSRAIHPVLHPVIFRTPFGAGVSRFTTGCKGASALYPSHPQSLVVKASLEFSEILPEDPKLYDKMRPPKKDGNPTTVYFHVTVMGLDSIDETSMTYAADIFFAQTWKDHRLRLPENMTSEYRLLEVDWLKNMWRPDSFFKNAKAVTFQTMTIPNHYMWLYKDKTILYMVKLTLTLSCAMNFLIYPHDTQECKLQMESLSHTTDDMIFQWDPDVPLVVDENIELPQLQLIKNNTADCTQVYSTGNFTCLEVVFTLKRRLGYYLFHTYIPTCLIVIMSWVSFWIKPEAAPARVTLGVTSLLTLSTQHAKSQASLPPVSYLKAVDSFMSVCTVFVFMALMEYCLVNIVLGDSDGPKANPEPPKPDKVFDLAAKENARLLTGQPPQPPRVPQAQRNRIHAINIDRFSRIGFPLLFAGLNISYWIIFAEYL